MSWPTTTGRHSADRQQHHALIIKAECLPLSDGEVSGPVNSPVHIEPRVDDGDDRGLHCR